MKKSFYTISGSWVVFSLLSAMPSQHIFAQKENSRPNIIFFLIDDMGWQDTSVPFWTQKTDFNRLYETPNMERLARQGM